MVYKSHPWGVYKLRSLYYVFKGLLSGNPSGRQAAYKSNPGTVIVCCASEGLQDSKKNT